MRELLLKVDVGVGKLPANMVALHWEVKYYEGVHLPHYFFHHIIFHKIKKITGKCGVKQNLIFVCFSFFRSGIILFNPRVWILHRES
jgi:hypothetical protein